jgi:hypothetical protein
MKKPHIRKDCGIWFCIGKFRKGGSTVEASGRTPTWAYFAAELFADKVDEEIKTGNLSYLG